MPYKSGKTVARQVSNALDHLLKFSGYDKRIRPRLGGPPIPVVINLSIRSMGPVDESRHVFSLDCYFRQSWVDPRLMYNATGSQIETHDWPMMFTEKTNFYRSHRACTQLGFPSKNLGAGHFHCQRKEKLSS